MSHSRQSSTENTQRGTIFRINSNDKVPMITAIERTNPDIDSVKEGSMMFLHNTTSNSTACALKTKNTLKLMHLNGFTEEIETDSSEYHQMTLLGVTLRKQATRSEKRAMTITPVNLPPDTEKISFSYRQTDGTRRTTKKKRRRGTGPILRLPGTRDNSVASLIVYILPTKNNLPPVKIIITSVEEADCISVSFDGVPDCEERSFSTDSFEYATSNACEWKCEVSVELHLSCLQVIIVTQKETHTIKDIDISHLTGQREEREVKKQISSEEIGKIAENICSAYSNCKSDDQRDIIFNNILNLLSQRQNDNRKRLLGLACLKQLYTNSHVEINMLWKKCKESFEIQPYFIIDVSDLELNEYLGQGTFGTVKKGIWQSGTGPVPVAVKIIQEDSQAFDLSDLRGELVALSLLQHPNVISMYGGAYIPPQGQLQSALWLIVMELMDGSLADIIHRDSFKALSFQSKLDITQQICSGILHLHKHRIIHRDIKPENILYKMRSENHYQMVIADFGICKPETGTLFRTAIGTFGYMAPELKVVKKSLVPFGQEVDIYSFGILLWELFTHKTVGEFQHVSRNFLASKVKVPSHTPKWISKLIAQCTSSQPEKRPTADQIYNLISNKKWAMIEQSASTVKILDTPRMGGDIRKDSLWHWCAFSPCNRIAYVKWKSLPEDLQEMLETVYKRNREAGSEIDPFNIQDRENIFFEKSDIATLLTVDLAKFQMKRSNSENIRDSSGKSKEKVFYLYRQRIPKDDENTIKLRLLVRKKAEGENGSPYFEFSVSNMESFDCTDVLQSVTFSYRSSNGEYVLDFVTRSPFIKCIPEQEGQWVNISMKFLHNEAVFDIPLFSEPPQEIIIDLLERKGTEEHMENIFPPYQPQRVDLSSMHQQICDKMKQRCDSILKETIVACTYSKSSVRASNDTLEENVTIFNGTAGYAYVFWKASTSGLYDSKANALLSEAAVLLKVAAKTLEDNFSSIGFFHGVYGVYALQAAVYHSLDCNAEAFSAVENLLSMQKYLEFPEIFDRKLSSGIAGYLSCLLFVRKHIPSSDYWYPVERLNSIMRECTELLCGRTDDNGFIVTDQSTNYTGAYHGLAGILLVLLEAEGEKMENVDHKEIIIQSLEFLVSLISDSGDMPYIARSTILGSMYWCRGVPGVIPVLLRAYQIFGNKDYLDAAKRGAEAVWRKGILRKGRILCHGIAGNAYVFLQMYQVTKEKEYFYKALAMCSALDHARYMCSVLGYRDSGMSCIGIPNNPLSLMEGKGGEACLAIDIHQPLLSSFPGYFGDI